MRIAGCGFADAATRPAVRCFSSCFRLLQSAIRNPQSAIGTSAIVAAGLIVLLTAQATSAATAAWAPQQSGTLAWLRAVHFVDERRGWAAGSKGTVIATDDGGRTWRALARPTEDALRDVFFSDQKTGWLVCERSLYALSRMEEARSYLLKTTDGGASWARVEVTGADAGVVLTRVVFADAQRGWALGEMGALYATRDGGATWARQRVPTQHLLLGASFLDPSQGWLVGAGATVLETSDGGAEWRGVGEVAGALDAARLNAVSFVDARRGWAVGSGGVVVSTANGGRTWARQQSGTDADLSDVKFFDAREGWAVGARGTILRTEDGGATWAQVESGTTHPLERLAFTTRARGWAVGFGGTVLAYAPANAQAPRINN
ncbi:MAG: WD40/YVTN/BNR-like repeat-containing protein [Pyrinomonadaceae bacterium]